MKAVWYIAPAVSIGFLTVLAALPWGLPSEDRFFLPLLPVVAIHYWALREPAAIPEWFVFLAGLLLDIFTHGPLGYWPAIYLATYMLGVLGEDLGQTGKLARLGLFTVSLAAVAGLSWAVASVYFLEFADWYPYLRGAALAAAAAFLIMPILRFLHTPYIERESAQLSRGA